MKLVYHCFLDVVFNVYSIITLILKNCKKKEQGKRESSEPLTDEWNSNSIKSLFKMKLLNDQSIKKIMF